MKKFTRFFSLIAVLIIALSALAVTAFAESTSYEIDELYMSIPIPNDMLAITRNSEKTDSYFSKFNLKYKKTMNNFKDGNIYLQAMKEDGSLTLTVTMTKDKNSEKLDNYANISDSELKSVMNKYLNDEAYKSGSIVGYGNLKYIYLTMSTKSGKKIIQAQQYLTVVNGMNITITLDAPAGVKLTSDDKETLTSIVEGTKIINNNFFARYKDLIVYGGVTLFGIVVVALAVFIIVKRLRNPDKKHKNIVHELAHEHRISETTKIPRKSIFNITKPTMSFLKNYKPIEEIEDSDVDENTVKEVTKKVRTEDEKPPVVSENTQEFNEKPLKAKKPAREVPLAEKIVANNVKSTSEPMEEDVPIAKPMEFSEDKHEKVEPINDEQIGELEDVKPERAEQDDFDSVDDYFDVVPDKQDMYAYSDVDTAVDEYSAAKAEARMIREERRESAEVVMRVFKAIGRGILNVLQGIWMVICYIIIHLKYFCINVFRAVKKSRAKKKRMKLEEERKRRAAEERRRQREAQRARQRQNANRGENDLVKMRSSDERRPARRTVYPSDRRPQQRPPQRNVQRAPQRPPRKRR